MFVVEQREVHIQGVLIEAKDEAEAIERVSRAEGEYLDATFEYSHMLDTDTWTIRKPDEDELL
jgi:hypothetical protein